MKTLKKFLPYLYFIVSFSAAYVFLQRTDKSAISTLSTKFTEKNKISDLISSVSVASDKIKIQFTESVSESEILSSFSLKTNWTNEPIFFPPNTAEIINMGSTDVTIRFFMPVVDNYSAELICGNRIFPINISLQNFTESEQNSQLLCHGKYFGTRWCEARNIYYVDKVFFFYSKAEFKFPSPLLLPGARAPPYDKLVDRFNREPIVTNISFADIPRKNKLIVGEISIIGGCFYNFYMLWHMLFDLTLPLYAFLKKYNIGTRDTRRIFLRSDGFYIFGELANAISRFNPIVLDGRNNPMFFKQAIIGIEKLEANLDPFRSHEVDSIVFEYNFNRSSCPGFRDDVINYNYIEVPRHEEPYVLVISRGTSKRDIKNIDEIVAAAKEICDFCKIEVVKLQDYSFRDQISKIAQAQVVIGFHGSGLTHTLWMEPSVPERRTHLLEFLPYGYNCRDWYHTAANVAGVEYHSVMNRNRRMPDGLSPEQQSMLQQCWNLNFCGSSMCHDRLRDQYVDTEMSVFNETWKSVVETLKK